MPMSEVLLHLRSLLPDGADLTDGQLLERFANRREPAALEALVRRHARMVWGVCRRVLGDDHDAEDAFQATFLVLVRKGASVRPRAKVGNWLYGVAHQTALKARANRARRRGRERQVSEMPEPATKGPDRGMALQPLLDQEVSRLPEKYRTVVVLCELQRRTVREAAQQLGCPPGTVGSRLARARALLARRLARHGLGASGAALAAALSEGASGAAVPAAVVSATVRAVTAAAAGQAAAGVVSGAAAALTDAVVKTMLASKLVKVTAALLLFAAIGGAAGLVYQARGTEGQRPVRPESAHVPPPPDPAGQRRADRYGDVLPPGALARLGTLQFRHPMGHEFSAVSDPTIGAAFSPDGKVLATSCWGRMRLWDANTGRFRLEIKEPGLAWSGHVFSPDGRFLAAYVYGRPEEEGKAAYVGLWDARTGRLRHRLPPEGRLKPYVRDMLFSPDGKLLALTQDKAAIHLWSTETDREVAVLSSGASWTGFSCIAFAPDGKTIVTLLHQPRKICHWDIARRALGKVVSLETLTAEQETEEGKTGTYNSYALSQDGRTLASSVFGDGVVRLLDTATGKVRCRLETQVHPTRGQMVFTPDGRFLATTAYPGGDRRQMVLFLSDTATGKLNHESKVPYLPYCLTFSPDGKRVLLGGQYLHMYDVAGGGELLRRPAHEGTIGSLAFTADGGTLISGGYDGMIGIWDAATGRSRHLLPGHPGGVSAVALVPGGSTFVSCGHDGLIRLRDWRTGKEVRRFGFPAEQRQQFSALRVSTDGKTVISQVYTVKDSNAPRFHSWGLAIGKQLRSYPTHAGADFAYLTAGGKYFVGVKYSTVIGETGLAQRGTDSTLEIREAATDRRLFTLRETDRWESETPLTPDGRLLIHGSQAGRPTIHVRELASGKARLSLRVAPGQGWGTGCTFALSPDGRVLAAADRKALHFWDLLTGEEMGRLAGHDAQDEAVYAMAFSPDGMRLATSHETGTILVWDVPQPRRTPARAARSAREVESWWKDLAGGDAAGAHAAIGNLVEAPEQAVGLFRERLRPAAPVPAAERNRRIARLIADLDAGAFATRATATRELATLRSEADSALRRALGENASLEKRRRIEQLLELSPMVVRDPELLRGLRAVEVLERVAVPEAGASRAAALGLLRTLAGGPAGARLTREAGAALLRLGARGRERAGG